MSWDALIAKTSGEDFHKPPENTELLPMGNAREIREIITRHFPETDWQRDGTGFLRSDSLFLEFRLLGKSPPKDPFLPIPDEELVQSIGFSARGDGDPVGLIASFARQNKWSVVDAQEGTWMDLRNVSDKSWKEFTGYRDRIFKRLSRFPVFRFPVLRIGRDGDQSFDLPRVFRHDRSAR